MEAEGLAAECFGAGADDYLKKPIDQELLSLKIQRLISPKGPKEPQGGINGSLADMNASDFIQNLSAGYKNVEITIESPGARGLIHIKNGVIIHAATDSKVGVEAFCTIVAWEEGDFHIASCSEFPDRTIQANTTSLLMEAARFADEIKGKTKEDNGE
jgi:hypothetical protein